jgi:hypothetical protein
MNAEKMTPLPRSHAERRFFELQQEVEQEIAQMKLKLKKLEKEAEKNHLSWGNAGAMGQVKNLLIQINDFLN